MTAGTPSGSDGRAAPSGPLDGDPVRFGRLLEVACILLPLAGTSSGRILLEFSELAYERGWVGDAKVLAEQLGERERLGSTAVGQGLAVPHARSGDTGRLCIAAGVAPHGVEFGAGDGIPTRLFFLLLSPPALPNLHIQALAQLSRIARVPGLTDRLLAQRTPDGFLDSLRAAEGD